jgi:hypothetical protein
MATRSLFLALPSISIRRPKKSPRVASFPGRHGRRPCPRPGQPPTPLRPSPRRRRSASPGKARVESAAAGSVLLLTFGRGHARAGELEATATAALTLDEFRSARRLKVLGMEVALKTGRQRWMHGECRRGRGRPRSGRAWLQRSGRD